MRSLNVVGAVALIALAAGAALPGAAQLRGAQGSTAQPITIEQLIDIKHPSNPVWSRDSKRIAFTWERAGVANLYVVPTDGSTPPLQVTKEGVPGNVFWSPDSRSLLFFRGGSSLMRLPLDGGAASPVPSAGNYTIRSPSVSRDGTRMVYLSANGEIRVRSLVDDSDS